MNVELKTAIRHTLTALKEHVRLQGFTLYFDLIDMSEGVVDVRFVLEMDHSCRVELVSWVRAADRNTAVSGFKEHLEALRDKVLPAFLGPARG
jgi:hypothetical protein